MKKNYTLGLICAATFALSACGGSGGGDSAADTIADTVADTELPTPDGLPDGSENDTPDNIDTDSASSDSDNLPLSLPGDRICASHVATGTSIGNSTFTYNADSGQCYGTNVPDVRDIERRLITTQVIETTSDGSIGNLSVEAEGRLTINPLPEDTFARRGVDHRFIAGITNNGSQTVCLTGFISELVFADILNEQGDILSTIRLEFMGDQYQVPTPDTSDTSDIFENCIPAGETRTVAGGTTDTDADLDPEVIASYDRIEMNINTEILGADAERAENLTPLELSWTAFGIDSTSSVSSGFFPYTVILSLLNPSQQTMQGTQVSLTYIDSEGFFVFDASARVGDFLDGDPDVFTSDSDLTPEEITLDAAGGTLSFRDDSRIINVDDFGNRGPADQVLVHFRRCFDDGCSDL